MKRRKSVNIAINALLLALTIIFCVVPLNIGPLRLAVLMLMPTLVAGQTQRVGTSIFASLFLGVLSLIMSFVAPSSPVSYAFQNPMISIFPRLFIGIVVYFSYHGIKKVIKNEKVGEGVALSISSAAGIITNTGLVSLMLWLFYGKNGIQGTVIDGAFMETVILMNFVVELIVCTIIAPPISIAVKKILDRIGEE